MPGFGGDFRKNEKKKISKKELEEKAKKMTAQKPYVLALPKLVKEK
ncbi:hypothetical protein HY030_00885 [Candidatus Gottesmanbacteria bacterium]|nr:hypothetical protein [Candidatus Gottesmanbacteria bacterium]